MRAVAAIVVCSLAVFAVAQGPPKPQWPQEFDSPFALYDLTMPTPVVNGPSHFYYNWKDYQSQTVSYPAQCVPLLDQGTTEPCTLYFNPNNGTGNVYLSQPALGQDCCLVFPGVGAVPPAFLAGFTWNGTQSAVDMNFKMHECNYWTGSGFAYWTDISTNHDIFFNDGGSGAYWAWGAFSVVPQPESLFVLPASLDVCNTPCPGFGAEHALKHVPLIRMAMNAQKALKAEKAKARRSHHRH